MAEFKLHAFEQSGHAYRVALMLQLAGCDWEGVRVPFFDGVTRTETWRETHNEMGEAPILEHGETKLTQSGVILDYLADITGQFGGRSPEERREIWRWILFDNHKFTSYYSTLRFLLAFQKTGETEVVQFLRGRVLAAYGIVDKQLGHADFIVGERPTIADFSMAGYVFYPEETGVDVPGQFPAIEAWKERIRALPGWQAPYDLMRF
jgi:glutathione S-transferase